MNCVARQIRGRHRHWTTTVVPNTRPPIIINDLTSGVKYTFRVRAFGKLGFSDWSNPVDRMCI
jgi:hypothetical protein